MTIKFGVKKWQPNEAEKSIMSIINGEIETEREKIPVVNTSNHLDPVSLKMLERNGHFFKSWSQINLGATKSWGGERNKGDEEPLETL